MIKSIEDEKAIVRPVLEQYIYEAQLGDHYTPDWFDLLSYCAGYFDGVTTPMIMVVRDLQREGKCK